jgi:hypothetical protein
MKLIEVHNKQTERAFLDMVIPIYAGDPNYIQPLDEDVASVFNPDKNKFFGNGQATRWILLDEQGGVVGRVAAFINERTAHEFDQPTGGMGFFECVEDQDAAFLLFDTCKAWLEQRGMEAMDGPINFGERDRFWGLLVEGFSEPTYGINYHRPYYQRFFDAYGFRSYFDQFIFHMKVQDPLPPKIAEKAAAIAKHPKYHFEYINKGNLEKYAEDFRKVYNEAWAGFDKFKQMEKDQAVKLMRKIKPVMDPKLIWFSYYEEEPVGFFLMLPDINQIFRYVRKLNWWGKLEFAYHKWRGTCTRITGLAFGISPEHQGTGLEGAMINATAKVLQPMKQYSDIELTWIGSFNPKMLHVVEGLGAKQIKKLITYRKLFDKSAVFKPAPSLDKYEEE